MSMKLMEAIAAAATECAKCNSDDAVAATPEEMADFGNRYLKKHEFKPGDLVKWKKGLRNCRMPAEGSAGVVMEVIPGQRENISEGHMQYAPADVRVGVIIKGGFEGFWLDGSRLEPYAQETPAQ